MRPLLVLLLCASIGRGEEVRRLRAPMVVEGSLDLKGVVLAGADEGTPPDRFEGIGLLVEGRRGITIRNARLRGFRCAILLRDCEGVVLEDCDVSDNFRQRLKSTPEREDPSDWLWPHENDEQQWRKNYGAGICLENCRGCRVVRCTARRQQNGILLDRCRECRIEGNDASFNSGWGLALWRSDRNRVDANRFDFCVRGYSHGVYDRGQDSAGILVFEQSSGNGFFGNSATHGGDGFFLYAGHETTQRTGEGGCNDNIVLGNDFSHAVANAIEATFSRGNLFAGNRCNGSNYGIWAGYSYASAFQCNEIRDNSVAGIAIEHGESNSIRDNRIEASPRGIWLWWDDDKDLLASAFGKRHACASRGYRIVANAFRECRTPLLLAQTKDVVLLRNEGLTVEKDDGSEVAMGEGPALERDLARCELPPREPAGRHLIMIDEWGPLDPAAKAVFPREVHGSGACAFHVLGATAYEVEGVPAGFEVERGPRGFRVRGGAAGLHAFSGQVRIGDERFPFAGALLNAKWRVRWWSWTQDPRESGGVAGGSEPLAEVECDALEFSWRHDAPHAAVPRDGFATRAETRLPLAAGRYELRTKSDDGIRVTLDGKVIQEDWTWHGPTEHVTDFEVAAGEHHLVVEHFELDGYAVLILNLSPLAK